MYVEVCELKEKFIEFKIFYVKREFNKYVDYLVNMVVDFGFSLS